MKKIILYFLLLFTVTLGLVYSATTHVNAAEAIASGTCGDHLTWVLDDAGTLTISGTGAMTNYTTASKVDWYSKRSSVKTVVIEDGASSIGSNAFYYCSSLTSVTIPQSVTTIGTSAFSGCSKLSSIVIPDTVTDIGNQAFYNCASLTAVSLPENLTRLRTSVFNGCSKLAALSIPDTVTRIDESALRNCAALKSVTVSENVTFIGTGAFCGCTSLTQIQVAEENRSYRNDAYGVLFNKAGTTLLQAPGALSGPYSIPDTVTTIGVDAFFNCSAMTEVYLPDTVTTLGGSAFSGCSGLTAIALPGNITSVESYTFTGCTNLKAISIPVSVTNIKYNAFSNCSALNHVAYTGTESQWDQLSKANNSVLTSATCHFETVFQTVSDCLKAGIYCPICEMFITQTQIQGASHSYPDGSPRTCANCGHIRNVTSVSIATLPQKLSYTMYEDTLDITGGMLLVNYDDGAPGTIPMTDEMVSGFDNTRMGNQTLSVSYEGFSTTYTVTFTSAVPQALQITSLPTNRSYLIGQALDLTGLSVTAYYKGGHQVLLTEDQLQIQVDMTSAGVKPVTVTYCDISASFAVFVHERMLQTVDSSLYPESTHEYLTFTDETKTLMVPGATYLVLTFNSSCATESGYDYVYVLDSKEFEHAKFTGNFGNSVVTVPGCMAKIRLTSDRAVGAYGYGFSMIQADTGVYHPEEQVPAMPATCTRSGRTEGTVCEICGETLSGREKTPMLDHEWEAATCTTAATCTMCGQTQGDPLGHDLVNAECSRCHMKFSGFIQLDQDMQVTNISLTEDLYVDLAGFDLSGTIQTNGYRVYGMDSSTDEYTCETPGIFSCVDEAGTAIVPVRHFATDISGTSKRYLSIKSEAGYSFHRFYLGVTHMSVKPNNNGVGYKAVFCGDGLVAEELESYGYSLWFDGYQKVTGSKNAISFVSGQSVTLRINDFDAANFGEKELHATVSMTLKDGTVIESTGYTMTLRELVEAINEKASALTQIQLQAIGEMIKRITVMQTWMVENLYHEP